MTLSDQNRVIGNGVGAQATAPPKPRTRRCRAAVIACLLLLLTVILVALILGLTVFKVRQPKTQVVSASLEGVAPRISFPAIKVELNVTLNLTLLIQNKNHARFKTGQGEGVLLYKGNTVGETQLPPGLIRARDTSTLYCLLTVEVDRFAGSGLNSLINDISTGELVMETKTRIPGRVTIIGIFHKHIVSTSDCKIVIGFPDLNIKSQDCKHHDKL